jgi:Sulfotransferase family
VDRRQRGLLEEGRVSERPVLVVGSPRSGTTLLRDLLRAHPRLTFPQESNVLPALWRLHGEPATERRARRLARDLLGSFSTRAWQLDVPFDELVRERTFVGMTAALYEAWARKEGKPRWGDKTPLYALELPVALAIFPGAQVVHLVRDGRDVAASLLRQPWGPRNVTSAARLWRRCVETARSDGEPLGPDGYLELRYERLVAEPEEVLRGLCAFLGEEFDPALLRPSRIPAPPGIAQPWPAAHDAAIDPHAAGRWEHELSPDALALFDAEAGATLRSLGYPSDVTPRMPTPRERVTGRAADTLARARWRATTWDRVPRATTTLRLGRARLLRAAGLVGGR